MAFQFSEFHIQQHRTLGYTVFQKIIPDSLLRDLRNATVRVREIVFKKNEGKNHSLQRMQPITQYGLDLKPFQDYLQLPELVDSIARLLTPQHRNNPLGMEYLALLIGPPERPWGTPWHRDLQESSEGVDPVEFRKIKHDPSFFTQVNCPLYEDTSTWYVPGSHLREDFPEELAVAKSKVATIGWKPVSTDVLAGKLSIEEAERLCLKYCEAMPGAFRFVLDAGDFAVYQPLGWHLGNYASYKPRMTIHHVILNQDGIDWYDRWHKNLKEIQEKKARI